MKLNSHACRFGLSVQELFAPARIVELCPPAAAGCSLPTRPWDCPLMCLSPRRPRNDQARPEICRNIQAESAPLDRWKTVDQSKPVWQPGSWQVSACVSRPSTSLVSQSAFIDKFALQFVPRLRSRQAGWKAATRGREYSCPDNRCQGCQGPLVSTASSLAWGSPECLP